MVQPMDPYNQELLSNVHPPDWKNPEPLERYNLVVIGAGPAGLVTAAGAARLGARVALVERRLMGGDCLNVGCVPSKLLINASRSPEFQNDFPAAMERLRRIRARISAHDSARRFQSLGVDVFLGRAQLIARDQVQVDGRTLRFKKAVIATGTRPFEPPIEGLPEAGYLTNETVFDLTERPPRLMVIGGGPIGCELAQAFRRLGSQITIVEMESQFLLREDPDAAHLLAEVFKREGIKVRLSTKAKRVARTKSGQRVFLEKEGHEEVVDVDAILVSVGRIPNIEGLGLETAGIQYDEKGIRVNDRLQTSNASIYAAGDICSPYKFTHMADAAARIVIQNALFRGRKRFSSLIVPWCTYTDPEIAHVGMYERDARKKGIAVRTFQIPLNEIDRAIIEGEDQGFVKVHVRDGTDKILGATIVAAHAGDLISEFSLAMTAGTGLSKMANVIHPYPTQAEAIRKAGDAYNRTRLSPLIKKIFSAWLSWTR